MLTWPAAPAAFHVIAKPKGAICSRSRGADGDISPQTLTDLSSPGAQSLIVRFNPTARGAVLEI